MKKITEIIKKPSYKPKPFAGRMPANDYSEFGTIRMNDAPKEKHLNISFPAVGRCQCGLVQYRLTGRPLTVFACHCTDCQHQSSSAFGMGLWARVADVEILQGELKEWVRDMPSGHQMACRFCSNCGTRLFHQVLGQNQTLSIKPGTLDDTSWLKPAAHIWTRSRQRWFPLDDATLQYPGNPDNFDDLMAAWHQQALS